MRLKTVFYSFLLCCFTLALNAQVSDNTKPTYQGKISSVEYVASIASRPGDLLPLDKTPRVAKDRTPLSEKFVINEDPQKEDDYFVRNRNPQEGSRASSPPSVVFDAYTSAATPTDPSTAIGPNHIFVTYNTGFAIYDKTGVELVPQSAPNPAIFPTGGCCDLTVSYDNAADRWVLSFLTSLGGGAQIAVSDGPDPVNDGWYIYNVAGINDYQKLSVWSDGYYMTNNDGGTEKVWALERDLMLAGDPNAQILGFDLPGISIFNFLAPQALNVTNDDLPAAGGATIVFMQDDAFAGVTTDHLKVWTIDVDWVTPGNSTISGTPQEIPLTPFIGVFDNGNFGNLDQPVAGAPLDALQQTIMNQAQFRKFPTHNSALFTFVVDTDAGAGKLAGVRWMELRQTADNMPWTLYQEGTYTAPDGRHAWMASMAMDKNGSIGMGYTSMSGPTTPTDIEVSSYYTGRLDGDPLGTMTLAEELIANGTSNISGIGNRYGDYGKMDLDPADDETFWFITEYQNGGRKGVIGAFDIEVPDYCESQSGSTLLEYISNVQLNTIDNTSNDQFYSDFTAISTDLIEGNTYTISITPTWPEDPDNEAYAVWIDYNGDLDFEDAGELVYSAAPSMDNPSVGTFTVPTGTIQTSTRMRVSLKWNDIPDPCESFAYGEVEDYTINLIPEVACNESDFNDGESGLGIWVDGGADATLVNNASFANSGTHSFLLKDNTSTSTFTTTDFDLAGFDQVDFEFNYITDGFLDGHDFWLQVSTDGGATFSIEKYYFLNADFQNGVREFETISIGGPFSANTQFRFRCDAEGNSNKVYIDDIKITSCNAGFATCTDGIKNGDETGVDCGGLSCAPCLNCNEFDSNDGESGWGLWIDGGLDAILVNNATFANSGTYSFLIKDDTPQSHITSVDFDLSDFSDLTMTFNYLPAGFNNSFVQDFWLQMSTDGGATFTTIKEYKYLVDFDNGVREFESIFIEGPFTPTTKFRFQCDASGNSDKIYLDDIVIEACSFSSATCSDGIKNQGETEIDCGGPNCSPCSGCFDQGINDFEANAGVWNDGGADCRITPADAAFANSGSVCVRLQDDSPTSVVTTNNLDLSLVDEGVIFDFNFITNGFVAGDGFYAEYSMDGGATFTEINYYEFNVDFVNGVREFPINDVFAPFTSTTQFRIRCSSLLNSRRLYIDDIIIEGCYSTIGGARESSAIASRINHDANLKSFTQEFSEKINVYPNPTNSELNIDISEGVFDEVLIYSSKGELMHKAQNGSNKFSLDVSDYSAGMYFIRFISENDLAITKRFVKE